MARYKVNFIYMISNPEISDGNWHSDFLDNNGAGFTLEEAHEVAAMIRQNEYARTKKVDVQEMKEA